MKEEFHLDPNVGAGYVIYKSGMRTFNNMRYEFYKNTENIADAFILKCTKYVVSIIFYNVVFVFYMLTLCVFFFF